MNLKVLGLEVFKKMMSRDLPSDWIPVSPAAFESLLKDFNCYRSNWSNCSFYCLYGTDEEIAVIFHKDIRSHFFSNKYLKPL